MTTPDPPGEDGTGQQDGDERAAQDAAERESNRELFGVLLAEVLKSPGDLIEDLLAAAVENSNRRREHHELPPGSHYARRG